MIIKTNVQHKLLGASLIECDLQPNMDAYDHLIVSRIPVLSTYCIIPGQLFMTVITFFHVLWIYILLL